MTRLIAVVLLLVILWLAVKSFSGQLKAAVLGQLREPRQPPAPRAAAETLVRCAGCGAYLAASRALRVGDEAFCSEECRQRGAA